MSRKTNIVPFPPTLRETKVPPRAAVAANRKYEFTEDELAVLCRWFSAMKDAFPGT